MKEWPMGAGEEWCILSRGYNKIIIVTSVDVYIYLVCSFSERRMLLLQFSFFYFLQTCLKFHVVGYPSKWFGNSPF